MDSNVKSEINLKNHVAKPTKEQFANFAQFIDDLQELSIDFVKVIPPDGWTASTKEVEDGQILHKVMHQRATNLTGGSSQLSTDSSTMTHANFKNLAKQKEIELGIDALSIDQIEALHWDKNTTTERLYSIDNAISLFGDDVLLWNLDCFTKRESIIHSRSTHHTSKISMPGIHSPYVNFGSPLSSFAFHIEDGNLYAINYLHKGKPKIWYLIKAKQAKKFEKLAKSLSRKMDCSKFLRHKLMLILPKILKKHKIEFVRMVQNAGEFMITFGRVYHSGFNCGYNISEAINFGNSAWLDIFEDFDTCDCNGTGDTPSKALNDLRKIVAKIERKFCCQECPAKYSLVKNLNVHMQKNHAKLLPRYICPNCTSHYNNPYALRNHLECKHNLLVDLVDVKKWNTPIKNTKKIQTNKVLHRQNPIKRRQLTCTKCGNSYAGKFNFNRHNCEKMLKKRLSLKQTSRSPSEHIAHEDFAYSADTMTIKTSANNDNSAEPYSSAINQTYFEDSYDDTDDRHITTSASYVVPTYVEQCELREGYFFVEPTSQFTHPDSDIQCSSSYAHLVDSGSHAQPVMQYLPAITLAPENRANIEKQAEFYDSMDVSLIKVEPYELNHSSFYDEPSQNFHSHLNHSPSYAENCQIGPIADGKDDESKHKRVSPIDSASKADAHVKKSKKRRSTTPISQHIPKSFKLTETSSLPPKLRLKMKDLPRIPKRADFSGSLRMKPLVSHTIPDYIIETVLNDDRTKFDAFKEAVSESRTDATQYIQALKGMIFLSEAEESKHLKKYDQKKVQFQLHSKHDQVFKVEINENMFHSFKNALNDSVLDGIIIKPCEMETETINGKIERCDQNYIYIKITKGFEEMVVLHKSPMQFFDVYFHINQTPYQLQLQALDYVKEHGLFEKIINSPLMQTTNEERHTIYEVSRSFSCTNSEKLNDEQKVAIQNITEGHCHPLPYLLNGPPGTGKTRTLVGLIEHLVRTSDSNILVCSNSNYACDEVTARLQTVLRDGELYRMYAKTYKKAALNPEFEKICNLQQGEFKFPPLSYLYKFRVLICTLSSAGCLVRANGEDPNFDPKHFKYIIIDESGCTHETVSLIPIAGLCTEPGGKVNSCIVLSGDPKQLDAVTKSKYAKELGFNKSLMEQLSEKPIYQRNETTKRYNVKYGMQLVKNYRSHPDILKVSNEQFYDNMLEYEAKDEMMIVGESTLLLGGNSRVIFNSIQGSCEQAERSSSYFNEDEVKLVLRYVHEIINKLKINNKHINPSDIGIQSPYSEQCSRIREALSKEGYTTIDVGSAEIFQGQERPVIIISTVRTGEKLGFITNPQRFNVMNTRAQSLLIVIGHHESLYRCNYWKELVDHCISLGTLINKGRVIRHSRVTAP